MLSTPPFTIPSVDPVNGHNNGLAFVLSSTISSAVYLIPISLTHDLPWVFLREDSQICESDFLLMDEQELHTLY